MNRQCGIYAITNTVNGKQYIGSSCNISHRWGNHKSYLRRTCHYNAHLQRAWNMYGEESFTFEVLLLCEVNELFYYEQTYIDALKPEYNLAVCVDAPLRGTHHSEDTRRKLREAWLTRDHTISDEQRTKMSEAQKGKHHVSAENRRKLSEMHKGELNYNFGKRLSEEIRCKMSEAQKNRPPTSEETRRKRSEIQKGKPGFMLGKHHTKETIQKIIASNKGKHSVPCAKETRAKISESLKGEHHPMFGKKLSEETKRKKSEAMKRYWAERKGNI